MKTFASLRLLAAGALVAGALTSCAGTAPAGSGSAGQTAPQSQPLTFSSPLDIQLSVGGRSVLGQIEPTVAGRDLVSKLPLTLTFDDRFSHAKTAVLPTPIDVDPSVAVRDYRTGDIAYWPEGGQIAVIYGPDGAAVPEDGLVPLGRITAGLDALAAGANTEITIRVTG
jgi:hypothetical protein